MWCADLLEASVPAWPRAISLLGTLVMIAHASEFGSCASPWIGLTVCTPIRRGSSRVQSGWGAVFHHLTLLWEGTYSLEGPAPRKTLLIGALTLGASRGSWCDIPAVSLCLAVLLLIWGTKLRKVGLDGCLLPITFPVTVGWGEDIAGALNALAPVPATGGGECFCARGSPIRSTLFP